MEVEIPYGYCHCGCGKKTKISNRTDNSKKYPINKGEPFKYICGHGNKKRRYIICGYCGKEFIGISYTKYCIKSKCKQKAYYKKYPKIEGRRKIGRKRIYNILDSYIKELITKKTILKSEDISKEFMDIYRQYLIVRRMVKKTILKGEQYVKHARTA